jgi:acetyltransferase EpsM
MTFCKKIFIIGAGGHGKSISSFFLNKKEKIFYIDKKNYKDLKNYYGNDNFFIQKTKKNNKPNLYIGIGYPNKLRKKIFLKYKSNNFNFKTFVHESCTISKNVIIGEGSIVFPNVVIGNNVKIGANTIIYSNATIEHDTQIGNHCYISPSVTICGNVKIGNEVFFGAGACVLENASIKSNKFIKAQSLLKK